jgi:hypothetical protein
MKSRRSARVSRLLALLRAYGLIRKVSGAYRYQLRENGRRIVTAPPGGNKSSEAFGKADFWLLAIDPAGNKQWEQTFGGSGNDHIGDVLPTPDGGFIFAGYSDSVPSGSKTAPHYGSNDFWVIKLRPHSPPP